MNSIITKLLDEEQWMIQNSITFGDGTVLLLEKIRLGDSSFEIRTKGETNISSLVTPDYNYFSFIDVYKIIKEESITIYVGGGSFGGDGFVYLINNTNGELIWLAFFDFCNPFLNAFLEKNQIIAENNNGQKWRFLLDNPGVISIV